MSDVINKIFRNCVKAKNRQWSSDLIKKYVEAIDKEIDKNKQLALSTEVKEILEFLEKKDKENNNKLSSQNYSNDVSDTESDCDQSKMALPQPNKFSEGDNFEIFLEQVENYFFIAETREEKKPRLLLLPWKGS